MENVKKCGHERGAIKILDFWMCPICRMKFYPEDQVPTKRLKKKAEP